MYVVQAFAPSLDVTLHTLFKVRSADTIMIIIYSCCIEHRGGTDSHCTTPGLCVGLDKFILAYHDILFDKCCLSFSFIIPTIVILTSKIILDRYGLSRKSSVWEKMK